MRWAFFVEANGGDRGPRSVSSVEEGQSNPKRSLLSRHAVALQRTCTGLALILAVVLGFRLGVRSKETAPDPSDPLELLKAARLDDASFKRWADSTPDLPASTWKPESGPDGSYFDLSTRCIRGVLYYKFGASLSPKTAARYRRTYSPWFRINLIDSAGFKRKQILLAGPKLVAVEGSASQLLSANDTTDFPCRDYLEIKSWEANWGIGE